MIVSSVVGLLLTLLSFATGRWIRELANLDDKHRVERKFEIYVVFGLTVLFSLLSGAGLRSFL